LSTPGCFAIDGFGRSKEVESRSSASRPVRDIVKEISRCDPLRKGQAAESGRKDKGLSVGAKKIHSSEQSCDAGVCPAARDRLTVRRRKNQGSISAPPIESRGNHQVGRLITIENRDGEVSQAHSWNVPESVAASVEPRHGMKDLIVLQLGYSLALSSGLALVSAVPR